MRSFIKSLPGIGLSVAVAVVASIFEIPAAAVTETKAASKFLMVCALVVIVALLVEICMGIV